MALAPTVAAASRRNAPWAHAPKYSCTGGGSSAASSLAVGAACALFAVALAAVAAVVGPYSKADPNQKVVCSVA